MSSIKNFIWKLLFDDSDTTDKLAKNQSAIDTQAEDWRATDDETKKDIIDNQALIDAQAAEWQRRRMQILSEMRDVQRGIGLMIQSIRMVVQVTGQALSPVQDALLSMISSTSSIIIATATAMATGSLGLLSGAALFLASYAWAFSMAQSIKVIAQAEETAAAFAAINGRLAEMESSQRMMGVSF